MHVLSRLLSYAALSIWFLACWCHIEPAVAQTKKLPVFLDTTVSDDDPVGRLLAFELKEAILGSNSFRSVEALALPYLKLSIVTVKISEHMTAGAVSYVYDSMGMPMLGALITSSVQTCGIDRVKNCARSILANLNEAAKKLGTRERDMHLTLQNAK